MADNCERCGKEVRDNASEVVITVYGFVPERHIICGECAKEISAFISGKNELKEVKI